MATPVAIVVAGVLAFLAWQQSRLYADAITLYRATLVRNPECWLIENNLGSALFDVDQLPEAVRHYRRALELNPKYAEAHDNLGVTLEKIRFIATSHCRIPRGAAVEARLRKGAF